MMRQIHRRLSLLLIACGVVCSAQTLEEYQMKTAYMLNIAKFTDWPGEDTRPVAEPFTICVVGLDPFGHWLDDAVALESPKGRPLNVRRISSGSQAAGCRIVFLSSSERKKFAALLTEMEGLPILTMGDSDQARDAGVVVNFCRTAGRIRFEVNVEAAEKRKLRISARLLSLATIVKNPN